LFLKFLRILPYRVYLFLVDKLVKRWKRYLIRLRADFKMIGKFFILK
jgi:hypothetical protein